MDIQLSQHHLLKRFSPLKLSWPSCQRSADHRLVSITGLLVLFLDIYVLLPGPHRLDYCSFIGFALGNYDFSSFVLFHDCCSGFLPIPFRISLSVSAPASPKPAWILILHWLGRSIWRVLPSSQRYWVFHKHGPWTWLSVHLAISFFSVMLYFSFWCTSLIH